MVGDGDWVAAEVWEVARVIAVDKTEAECLVRVQRSERIRVNLQRCTVDIVGDVGSSESDIWFLRQIGVTQCDLVGGSCSIGVNKLVPERRAGTIAKDTIGTWLIVEPGIFGHQIAGKDFDRFAESVVVAESVEVDVTTYEVTSEALGRKALDRGSNIVVVIGKEGWWAKTAALWGLYCLQASWGPNDAPVIAEVNHEVWWKFGVVSSHVRLHDWKTVDSVGLI